MLRITSRNSSGFTDSGFKKAGFTLIEVMIVIAVIGILSAVAIPAYQKYATRAKVSEVVTIMSELKASVSQCIQSRGGLAECNAVNSDIDENAVAASSDYITEVFVNAGVIRIRPTWSNLGDSSVDGLIELTPELAGSTRWTCRYQNALPSIAQYLPSNCRNEVP